MGYTKLYSGCRVCPYRETCSHKLLIGEGLLEPAAAPLVQPLIQPILQPHEYRHVKIDANTTITIDLEKLKKQLEESHFPPMLFQGGA